MNVFLVWMAIAVFCLSVYILVLLLKYRHRARFQIKLTVFFLLFVFVPTVPLTFFAANLLTQSADVLLLPGIGSSLETSLETIRLQIESRGERFFQEHRDPKTWSENLAEKEALALLGLYRVSGDAPLPLLCYRQAESGLNKNWTPSLGDIKEAARRNTYGRLIQTQNKHLMAFYRTMADSTVAAVVYPVLDRTIQAKDEITQALGVYNTLALLKESIIQKNLIWALAVLFIIGLTLLTVFVARALSRGISEPVQSLVGGMQRVAAGDLSSEVETSAKDEFRFLVDSFNAMIHDLETSRKKIIQAEKVAAWREVARQISHEIKNSLTPITLSLRRIRRHFRKSPLPPALSESLQTVDDELITLQNMVSEFSEFARMPEPQKTAVELNEVVRSVVRLTEASAGQTRIEMHLAPDTLDITADRQQIKRLLNNLIKNSIEASHDSGTVIVSTRRTSSPEHPVELEVRDEGCGMDEETREKIFQPYFTTKKKGTGLGLAIALKIVESHGGEIAVESEKNKGTVVRVFLP